MDKYGKWEIVGKIGKGGQGKAYKVRDSKNPNNPDEYALKALSNTSNPKCKERFKSEIEAVSKLSHRNIIRLIEYNLDSQNPYMVMEYCNGGNIEDSMFVKGLSILEILRLFVQICEGVKVVHDNGITHRDLKPTNIFITGNDNHPVIGDFGICHIIDGERMTMDREVVGSRYYMAPEFEGGKVEEVKCIADIYSLGKVLYRLIANRIFPREKHRDAQYDIVKLFNTPHLETINLILDSMIVENIDKRFQSVDEVIGKIKEAIYLLEKHANVIAPGIEQECIYCRKGRYYLAIDLNETNGPGNLSNMFGLQAGRPGELKFLICDHCGNVQLFHSSSDSRNWLTRDIYKR
jgi:serine/threonine protein kinase